LSGEEVLDVGRRVRGGVRRVVGTAACAAARARRGRRFSAVGGTASVEDTRRRSGIVIVPVFGLVVIIFRFILRAMRGE